MKIIGRLLRAAGIVLVVCAVCFARPQPAPAPAVRSGTSAKQIESLARLLKEKKSSWAYRRLSSLAERKSSGVLGKRAALALGYFDYQRGEYAWASKWLDLAKGDPLLGDYDLYWRAQNDLGLGRNEDALEELQQLRKDFPDSVMTEQALQSLGVAALAANEPAAGVAALDGYTRTQDSPQLLFLRGEAHQQAGQLLDAAADYQAVYLRFPLSDQARDASGKLGNLSATLGAKMPVIPVDRRLAHADALFNGQDWNDARNEYASLLPTLPSTEIERAEVRILECGVEMGDDPSDLAARKIDDPDVDAERDYTLADYYRAQQNEAQMAAAVEAAASRAPSSLWTEKSLFLVGNYYWVNLQRDRAANYYTRLAAQFPSSPDADAALWRVTWAAVLKREPDAANLLEGHLKRFPDSPYTPDTLYWLGRLAEEAKQPARARGFYSKLDERFAQTYFANLGAARLVALGPGPKQKDSLLALIPEIPAAVSMDDPDSEIADARRARAAALRTIAFDSSAMLELRAGYAATHQPRLLLEAAQEAVVAGQCGAAIVFARELYPELESRALSDVPRAIWLAAYALPFQNSIHRWSTRKKVDPMLVAGLIHQESAFDPKAVSNANAIGLMQLLPSTARMLARQQRLRFSRARLVQPDYNVRLGTAYFASLRTQFGNAEEALAAYNAGANRVTSWTAGQTYRDPAEFVESIPFTQTRQYVEIVERNAEIYRRLYRAKREPRKIHKRRHR